MGWPNIWKNARGVESASSSRNGNAALRAEIVGFDLAAHFLHAIVVFVDFMTFQTRNMRDAAEKLAGAVDSMRLCGIDRVSFLLRRLSCNCFAINILGV
jgi:ribulose kinase